MLIVGELGVRLAGLTDFPLYVRAPSVGYSLAPSQHGLFLDKNHWFVNAAGLINRAEYRSDGPNCLLVGDSVVNGGNPVDYDDRVGAIAEEKLHRPVWVASAGGWDLPNELAFLDRHPNQVRAASHIVFVLNKGDFGPGAPWTGELSFPTHKPIIATFYLLRRYVLPAPAEMPSIKSSGRDTRWTAAFSRFLSSYAGPVSVILYPDLADMVGPWPPAGSHDLGRANVIDARPLWNSGLFRDTIHPNVAGHRVLGDLVARACG